MAFAPSPKDGPLDDEERALLDSFYQGIAPRQGSEQARPDGLRDVPDTKDDATKVIAHPGIGVPAQADATPAEEKPSPDAGDDPFAALKHGTGNRSTIDLPGPRAGYRVEETSSGNFTIEHLASGEEVRVSGVDYLRFSDLQLHSEFLTRTNPPAALQAAPEPAPEPVSEPASEPEADPSLSAEARAEEDEAVSAEGPSEESPDADIEATENPEADYDSTFTAAEDGSITFSAEDLLGGPSGPGGTGMSVVAVAGGGNGTLVDNGDDSWTFTPDQAFDGSVELEVTIADGQGGIETAMATIEITPAKDEPGTEIQSGATSEEGLMAAGSVVKPDSDSGTMTYSLVSGPAEGTVSVHADGSYSFDPGSDFEDLGVGEFRDVCFIYHATDGQGGSDSGIVTITVTGSEDGPVASEKSLAAPESNPSDTPSTDIQPGPDSNDNATMGDDGGVAADIGDQSADGREDGAAKDDIQDRPEDRIVEARPEDRTYGAPPENDRTDSVRDQSPSGGEAADNPPQIDASDEDQSSDARLGTLLGKGDRPSREDPIAVAGAEDRPFGARTMNDRPETTPDQSSSAGSAAVIPPQIETSYGDLSIEAKPETLFDSDDRPSREDPIDEAGAEDRPFGARTMNDRPETTPDQSSSGGSAADNPPHIETSHRDPSIEAKPGTLLGSGDRPSREDPIDEAGAESRTFGARTMNDRPETTPDQSPSSGKAQDTGPQIAAGDGDFSSETRPAVLHGSSDRTSLEGLTAVPPAEQILRPDYARSIQADDGQEVSRSADVAYSQQPAPSFGLDSEERPIRTEQDIRASEEHRGDAQTESAKPDDTIDLSTARNWTVTYANGDSFTANDALDASLFTDTAGTIDFGNGDKVKFENVKQFTW